MISFFLARTRRANIARRMLLILPTAVKRPRHWAAKGTMNRNFFCRKLLFLECATVLCLFGAAQFASAQVGPAAAAGARYFHICDCY